MGYPTAIEWTDATWNPVGGCSIHSPGCAPCYAMTLAAHPRLNKHPLYAGTTEIVKGRAVWNGTLTKLSEQHKGWIWPLTWKGATNPDHPPKLGAGKPSLIFVGDMTDPFHEDRPRADIDRAVAPVLCSKHIGQLLTKRPDVMFDYFAELERSGRWRALRHNYFDRAPFNPITATWEQAVLPRLWLGCSAERQKEADERRPYVEALAQLGFTTFVSYEPALGPVDWTGWEFLRQLIAGGMSGKFATPAHPDWFRIAHDWCAAHGVAFFFKQWGEWADWNEKSAWTLERHAAIALDGKTWADLRGVPCETRVFFMERIGKKCAGRRLDGKTHNAFPEAA